MIVNEIVIEGDTPGIAWRIPYLTFEGSDANAPKVYIQAALHADELPGPALLHFLCEKLRNAETQGAILGTIVIVPQANPIGTAQSLFGAMEGRFEVGSRTNFNRDFPLISLGEKDKLIEQLDRYVASDRLKRHLMHMALQADLVLDLHCDDESLHYAYIDEAFWPEAADLPAAMNMEAVLLSDGESSAFEEAVSYAWKHENAGERKTRLTGKLSVTFELRGRRDVYPETAQADAEGLWRFLAGRKVIKDASANQSAFGGTVVPLDNVEMIRAPVPGTVLFHRNIGEQVKEDDLLAVIITQPGIAGGSIEIRSPQDGLIVTRASTRFVRRRGDLMKIACDQRSAAVRKPGTLED